MTARENLLEVKNLSVSYGNIKAVREISFTVREGELVALIGANGSGKTSILRAISGMAPFTGTITYHSRNLANVHAHKIVSLGIAHVPEGRGIFGNLTVLENLRLATWQSKDKDETAKRFEYVFNLFPRLKERLKQPGGYSLRGRAADAGCCTGADEPDTDDAFGRALDGPLSQVGAGDISDAR